MSRLDRFVALIGRQRSRGVTVSGSGHTHMTVWSYDRSTGWFAEVKQATSNSDRRYKVEIRSGAPTLKWPRSSRDGEPWKMHAKLSKIKSWRTQSTTISEHCDRWQDRAPRKDLAACSQHWWWALSWSMHRCGVRYAKEGLDCRLCDAASKKWKYSGNHEVRTWYGWRKIIRTSLGK